MKAHLIKQIDALSQALRTEGYEVKTTINLNQDTVLIEAKPSEKPLPTLVRGQRERA